MNMTNTIEKHVVLLQIFTHSRIWDGIWPQRQIITYSG